MFSEATVASNSILIGSVPHMVWLLKFSISSPV